MQMTIVWAAETDSEPLGNAILLEAQRSALIMRVGLRGQRETRRELYSERDSIGCEWTNGAVEMKDLNAPTGRGRGDLGKLLLPMDYYVGRQDWEHPEAYIYQHHNLKVYYTVIYRSTYI